MEVLILWAIGLGAIAYLYLRWHRARADEIAAKVVNRYGRTPDDPRNAWGGFETEAEWLAMQQAFRENAERSRQRGSYTSNTRLRF